MENLGLLLAIGGAAMATLMAGIGSAVGLGISSSSATGVLSEKPERYGLLTLMVVLPSTQGIYGFVVALFVMMKLKIFGGQIPAVTTVQGLEILTACIPVAFAGWISAIYQGKVGAAGIQMTAKRPELAFKAGVVYAAMVELYAILGFLVSLLWVTMGIKVG